MTNVALFSVQPILAAGVEAIFGAAADLTLQAATSTISDLFAVASLHRPSLLLIEASPQITLDVLQQLKALGGVPVVLWVDSVAVEFVSQVIALGVRGVIRKTAPVAVVLDVLRKVAAGEMWIEKDLCDRLIQTRRFSLTPRERQLLTLLAQGLKNKEIAHALEVTEGTVKVYLSRLFQKVGANDRFDLALFALKNLAANPAGFPAAVEMAPERASAKFLPKFVSFSRHVH